MSVTSGSLGVNLTNIDNDLQNIRTEIKLLRDNGQLGLVNDTITNNILFRAKYKEIGGTFLWGIGDEFLIVNDSSDLINTATETILDSSVTSLSEMKDHEDDTYFEDSLAASTTETDLVKYDLGSVYSKVWIFLKYSFDIYYTFHLYTSTDDVTYTEIFSKGGETTSRGLLTKNVRYLKISRENSDTTNARYGELHSFEVYEQNGAANIWGDGAIHMFTAFARNYGKLWYVF